MTFWTPQHAQTLLPTLAIALVLVVFLRYVLKNAPKWVRLLPLQIIAVAFLVLEYKKQTASIAAGYDNYHLPFHFCSLFLVVLPLAAFLPGFIGERLRSLAATLTLGVSLVTLVAPDAIYPAYNFPLFGADFFATHTIVFHTLVPIFFLFLCALDLYRPHRIDLAVSLVVAIAFCIVAYRASLRFDTHFSNFNFSHIEAFENARLDLAARRGEAYAARAYNLTVAAVHIVFTLVSTLLSTLLWWILHPKAKKQRA